VDIAHAPTGRTGTATRAPSRSPGEGAFLTGSTTSDDFGRRKTYGKNVKKPQRNRMYHRSCE